MISRNCNLKPVRQFRCRSQRCVRSTFGKEDLNPPRITMTRYFLFLILLATEGFANAESKLHGSWKSDLKLTSEYLQKYAKVSEHQKKAFNILFGKSVITFKSDGTGAITKEPFIIQTKDGGQIPMSGTNSTFSYAIIGESEGQVVIKITTKDPTIENHPGV